MKKIKAFKSIFNKKRDQTDNNEEVKKAFKLIADKKILKFYKTVNDIKSGHETQIEDEYSLNNIMNIKDKNII